MNVTKFIRQKRSQKLLCLIPMPEWNAGQIKVQPKGRNRATVGTAFDFMIASILQKTGHEIIQFPKIQRTGILLFDRKAREHEGIIYDNMTTNAQTIARSCVFLAKLHDSAIMWNMSGRRGQPASNFRPLKAEIQDIISMSKYFKPSMFRDFGPLTMQARICHGAVCDILSAKVIIDVKTTIRGELTRMQFDQCLAYALLSKKQDVQTIGIYFARHGKLFLHDISEYGTVKTRFKALFKEAFH